MRNNMTALMVGAKNKVKGLLNKKDAGIQTLIVIALVCAVAVVLTAFFKEEAHTLINAIFDTVTTNVNTTLFKDFTL